MGASDLIRRARELAALSEKATPGPWSTEPWGDTRAYVPQIPNVIMPIEDARLVAAAPEMARLLGEMADALEEARRSALEDAIGAITCEACDGRGRVAWNPNSQPCSVCDGSGLVDDPVGAIDELMEGE